MAAFSNGLCKALIEKNWARLKIFMQQPVVLCNVRHNHMFRHLAKGKEHDTKYEYEVSTDPEEWRWVEKLMPLETVPVPVLKPSYPSGWRPPKDEALQLPYFVERSKNHLLSVYLNIYAKRHLKVTKLKRISGDLWRLHDELKAHLEEVEGKRIASFVHEGNCAIHIKGDHVYYVEQWLLSKGF